MNKLFNLSAKLFVMYVLAFILTAHPRVQADELLKPGCGWIQPNQRVSIVVQMQTPAGRRWAMASLITKAINQRYEILLSGPRSRYQYYAARTGRFTPGKTVYPYPYLSIRNYGARGALFCWANGWVRV